MREFEHFCVCVRSSICMRRKVVLTQSSAARQPSGSGSPSLVLSGRYVLGCPARAARNPWPVLPARLSSSTRARTTPSPPSSMLRLVRDCFCGVLLLLVCLLLMLACMCVVLRVACCGVLQRQHNSDAVLKRLGSRHACKLTLNWLGTATRNSSAHQMRVYVDILFACPMIVSITAKFKAAKNTEKMDSNF